MGLPAAGKKADLAVRLTSALLAEEEQAGSPVQAQQEQPPPPPPALQQFEDLGDEAGAYMGDEHGGAIPGQQQLQGEDELHDDDFIAG